MLHIVSWVMVQALGLVRWIGGSLVFDRRVFQLSRNRGRWSRVALNGSLDSNFSSKSHMSSCEGFTAVKHRGLVGNSSTNVPALFRRVVYACNSVLFIQKASIAPFRYPLDTHASHLDTSTDWIVLLAHMYFPYVRCGSAWITGKFSNFTGTFRSKNG